MAETETGYLQHGSGEGPFRTEKVSIRHLFADRYQVRFDGRWRLVHANLSRYWIVYKGKRITLQWEGF